MSDTDLIRRGDAIAWCEEQHRTWAKSHGRDPEKYVGTFTIAADILRRIPARPEQEPPSPAPNTADLLNPLRWAHGTLYEINPSNYDHDEVCRLNDASVEVILGLAPVLGETHGKSPEWWTDHRVGPLPSPGVTAGATGGDAAERKRRKNIGDHHTQMMDAQAQCVPCRLCGGKAVITDAGPGFGYTIECENAARFRKPTCLQSGTRISGWAYNVSDLWNRLNAHPMQEPPSL